MPRKQAITAESVLKAVESGATSLTQVARSLGFKGSVGNDGVLRIEVDKNGVPIIELKGTEPKQAK